MAEGREQASAVAIQELQLESLGPLFAALEDPFVPVRCSAMRALARLPLGQEASVRYAAWMQDRLARLSSASAPDVREIPSGDVLATAGLVDAPAIRRRLYEIVRDGTDEQRRAAAHALANAGDRAAIPQLVTDLAAPDAARRLAAAKDLLEVGAGTSLDQIRERFATDPDPQVRAALAMVQARQDDAAAMVQLLEAFGGRDEIYRRDEMYPFIFGLGAEVRKHGAFPPAARAAIISAIGTLGDTSTGPLRWITELVSSTEAPQPPPGPLPSQWRLIGPVPKTSLAPELVQILEGQDGDRIRALDSNAVGQMVNALLGVVVDQPGYAGANDVVHLVALRPDYALDPRTMFKAYRALTVPHYAGPPMVPMQLAWALSRAGLGRVVGGLEEPLTSPDPRERLTAADLIELAAIYVHYSDPPIFSGGMGVGSLPPVEEMTGQLIQESQGRQDSEGVLRRPPQAAARPEFEPAHAPQAQPSYERAAPSSAHPPMAAPPPPSARPPVRAKRPGVGRSIGGAVGSLFGRVAASVGNAIGGQTVIADMQPDPPRKAYARVECPPVVAAAQEFELIVGIAARQSDGVIGDVLERPPTSLGEYVLSAQVVADGFAIRASESWLLPLAVTARNPYPAATLHLTADAPASRVVARTIQVLYSTGGQTIGAAFRPLAVVSDPALIDTTPPPPAPTGVDMAIPTAATACDLTVRISAGESGSVLLFTFDSPHAGATSSEPVRVEIGSNPDVFARQLVDQVNLKQGQPGGYELLVGFGKTVADKLPPKFWEALRVVREQVPDRAPTVLLLSQEPYIPWELAVMEPPLIDPSAPPFLGAQANVGRWVIGPRVKVPPPAEVNVNAAAVIWGVYDQFGWDRLTEAEDEASQMQEQYGAVSVTAITPDVLSCLTGKPPANLIHFAVHGIYNPQGGQDGLVLTDGQVLNPMEVRGFDLSAAPFVFLNACQVGSGNRILGDYAGMAAAFLYAGAAGVIAPLWSVNDKVAREIALDFYEKARSGSRPADLFRINRGAYTAEAGKSPTYLAYQYFGHPAMELVWRVRPSGGEDK